MKAYSLLVVSTIGLVYSETLGECLGNITWIGPNLYKLPTFTLFYAYYNGYGSLSGEILDAIGDCYKPNNVSASYGIIPMSRVEQQDEIIEGYETVPISSSDLDYLLVEHQNSIDEKFVKRSLFARGPHGRPRKNHTDAQWFIDRDCEVSQYDCYDIPFTECLSYGGYSPKSVTVWNGHKYEVDVGVFYHHGCESDKTKDVEVIRAKAKGHAGCSKRPVLSVFWESSDKKAGYKPYNKNPYNRDFKNVCNWKGREEW